MTRFVVFAGVSAPEADGEAEAGVAGVAGAEADADADADATAAPILFEVVNIVRKSSRGRDMGRMQTIVHLILEFSDP